MRGKPISLSNGRFWATQDAALLHFKEMLGRHVDGQIVTDPEDDSDLRALLDRYDLTVIDGPSKIGTGVSHFFRKRNIGDRFNTPGFWVHRVDSTETDFSYPHAVRGQPKSDFAQLCDACRSAVASDLFALKMRYFGHGSTAVCELSGETVTFDQAHLDHVEPTLSRLVLGFMTDRGWGDTVPPGTLTPATDNQTSAAFVDSELAEAFRQYHNREAKIRLVKDKLNLSMAASQRRK